MVTLYLKKLLYRCFAFAGFIILGELAPLTLIFNYQLKRNLERLKNMSETIAKKNSVEVNPNNLGSSLIVDDDKDFMYDIMDDEYLPMNTCEYEHRRTTAANGVKRKPIEIL